MSKNPFGAIVLNRTVPVQHQPPRRSVSGWDPNPRPVDGTATLCYRLDDPYALVIVFHTGERDYPWRVPRDVLARPLEEFLDTPLPPADEADDRLEDDAPPTLDLHLGCGEPDDLEDALQGRLEKMVNPRSRRRATPAPPGTARARLLPCSNSDHAEASHVILALDLYTRHGVQRIHFNPASVVGFLDATYVQVPAGHESAHLDLDGLIASLLDDVA